MRVLVVDTDGVGLAFCWRCTQAGHEVRWFIKPKESNHPCVGDGFQGITKVKNWVSEIKWADLVFVTGNDDYIERLDFFRKNGAMVFGPTQKSADLEIKRADGMKFLEANGIEVPPYKTFAGLKEAQAYVKAKPARYVFKTLGDNEDKSLSYVGKSPEDMIERLERWQRIKMNPKGEVMLQDFIEGIEMGVSRWMGTKGWVGPPNENFEFKKLMAGDIGPNTGEMGTAMAYTEESKLFAEVLGPLEKQLRNLGHAGDVDLNCIIDEKGKAWPLEFTNRPGWPAFNIMLATHKEPVKWMLDASRGRDTLEVSTGVALGVVLAQPDFPYSHFTKRETEDIPIFGVTKKNEKYIQPQSVMMKDGMWRTCGDYLAVVHGVGKTITQAAERAYSTVKEIHVPNIIYRNDIGKRLEEQIPNLHKLGFATSFEV